jgi:hypothetical protein
MDDIRIPHRFQGEKRQDNLIYSGCYPTLLYYLATATGYDFIFLLFGLPADCWIIWNLRPDDETPSD